MRCFQARRRLDKLDSDTTDPELLRHLQGCPACARLAAAERLLGKAFTTASEIDPLDLPTLEFLKQGVDSRLRLAQRTATGESRLMDTIKHQIIKRPRLGIGVGIALAAFLFLTLIPFAFDETIGYEVAFAGVDERLALNDEGLTELLHKLGVDDAEFDVSDCDKVCNVKVTNLRSIDEARLVQAAFKKLDNVVVLDGVSAIRGEATGSALKVFVHELGFSGDGNCLSNDELQCIVNERFGDSALCDIVLFSNKTCGTVSVDENGNHQMVLDCLIDSVGTTCCSTAVVQCLVGAKGCSGDIASLPEAVQQMLAGQGIDHMNLNGDIDDETLKLLAEKGISVERIVGPDGSVKLALTMTKGQDSDNPETTSESGDDDPAAKNSSSSLPEGYSLAQNYPNPFNPVTTIDYTVANSGPISLDVINVKGQIVRHLVDRSMPAGIHSVQWDATNERGERVSSGVYFYRMVAGDYSETKSMTLLK